MERIMPIRVVCTKKIQDENLKIKQIEPGTILDLEEHDFDFFLKKYNGCLQKIEMSKEEWLDYLTKETNECKKIISKYEKAGFKFNSHYEGIIPDEDSKVSVNGYAEGLRDAYDLVKHLKEDVKEFQSKISKFNVVERVERMPIRVVCTKKIQDENLVIKQIEPGTILDLKEHDFDFFLKKYNGCFQEIEMSEQDWINLATDNAMESKKRIYELEQLYGEKFASNNIGVIPKDNGKKVDGHGYGGGLPDAYNKTKLLKQDIMIFEKSHDPFEKSHDPFDKQR